MSGHVYYILCIYLARYMNVSVPAAVLLIFSISLSSVQFNVGQYEQHVNLSNPLCSSSQPLSSRQPAILRGKNLKVGYYTQTF